MSTLTPDETRQRLETILTAVQAQDIVRAQWLAREALDLGVQHALPLNLRAWWHESEGRYREALADLQRAENLAPDDVPVLNALGLAYARQGRMADAVACFDRILALDPNFPAAHFNKGWTSEDLGELDIARACYSRAAELTPQAADPPARLAALAARQGQWGEAHAQ
ncbi:MAG: tetratricopeptide repeat protein, partial [Alphaproteobacteria bacterium]|nr:tetratricopeptide repeat protein [Alphaproteobacteria bacterium]